MKHVWILLIAVLVLAAASANADDASTAPPTTDETTSTTLAQTAGGAVDGMTASNPLFTTALDQLVPTTVNFCKVPNPCFDPEGYCACMDNNGGPAVCWLDYCACP